MSDLFAGANVRASTGTTRTAGPVPVVAQSENMSTFRTPRSVLKDREEREARKRAEAAQQTRADQEEERRRSAERRANVAAPGIATATATSHRRSQSYTQDNSQQSAQRGDPTIVGRTPMRAVPEPYPTPSTGGDEPPQPTARNRAHTRTENEPRPVPTAALRQGTTAPTLRNSSGPTPSASTRTAAANSQSARDARPVASSGLQQPQPPQGQRSNASTFPHAFARWEQLSSHWEALTSYWLHKLESNQEAITRAIPTAPAMSRQITDLSAAGANLFHAVVELQRLRASSERKFQRWFLETRNEQDRDRELRLHLETALKTESDARQDAQRERERLERSVKTAESRVAEMRRELNISKDEARRAWEELGRREQEERDRTISLREGMPTVVGGVQVVPMHASAGVSRQGSQSQRPSTRGVPGAHGGYASSQGYSQGDPYLEDRPDSANTDPFTEDDRSVPAHSLHHEPEVASLTGGHGQGSYQPYSRSTPATSGSVLTAIPRTSAAAAPISPVQDISDTDEPERFYQQPPRQTQLYDPTAPGSSYRPSTSAAVAAAAVSAASSSGTQRQRLAEDARLASPDAASRAARDLRSEPSYVSTVLSEDEGTEYDIDSRGHLRRDSEGRPLVYRPAVAITTTGTGSLPPSAPLMGSPSAGGGNGHTPAAAPTVATRIPRGSEASDDYDTAADIARERHYAQRYGRGGAGAGPASAVDESMIGYEAPTPPPPAAGAAASALPPSAAAGLPAVGIPVVPAGVAGAAAAARTAADVERDEEEYGQPSALGTGRTNLPGQSWEVESRHHHPTRLSYIEEEEEGSRRGSSAG